MNRNTTRPEWKGYALSNVTDTVKKKVKADPPTTDDILHFIVITSAQGYKFSVTWDEQRQCYAASLYCQDAQSPNAGLMLALRHCEITLAIGALMFIHTEVYDEIWPTQASVDW